MRKSIDCGGWHEAKLFNISNSMIGKKNLSVSSQVSFLSFDKAKENNGELEVVSIKITEIKTTLDSYFMIEIADLSDVQTRGLIRL